MTTASLESKIRGCVLGAALGDALGGPFEFGPLERVPALTGGDWIDGLYPYERASGPHGVWGLPGGGLPPAGTATDDTRLNWLFLELANRLECMPSARDLATRYLEIYEQPDIVFPGHAAITWKQFEHWEGACRGYLGQTSELYPGLTPDVLLARSLGLNFPILSGLIAFTWAGLLFPGQPEEAYEASFRADFYDIGYAREAVALLAAAISIAIAEEITPQALYERIVTCDPLHLGGEFSEPFVVGHLPQYYPLVADPQPDQATAWALSVAFRNYPAFDPFRTFAVALLAVLAAEGNPMRSILIAVNHVGINAHGKPVRYEDIDCYGCIAGALAGALSGVEAFPPALLAQVAESNRAVYGLDLEGTIARTIEVFHRGR